MNHNAAGLPCALVSCGLAVAAFWLAIMLQLLFAMDLGWLPLRGEHRLHGAARCVTGFLLIDSLIAGRWTPSATPAASGAAGGDPVAARPATIARFTRAGVLETLQKDFVLYARAVGYRGSGWSGSTCCATPSP